MSAPPLSPVRKLFASSLKIEPFGRDFSPELISPVGSPKKSRRVGVPKFLRHLYRLLSVEDASIISWTADGLAFAIHDFKRFEQEILPRYYKHQKTASFQRQLNYFSFRKMTKSQTRYGSWVFSHPYFQRNQVQLLSLIKRQDSTTLSSPIPTELGFFSPLPESPRGSSNNEEHQDFNLLPLSDVNLMIPKTLKEEPGKSNNNNNNNEDVVLTDVDADVQLDNLFDGFDEQDLVLDIPDFSQDNLEELPLLGLEAFGQIDTNVDDICSREFLWCVEECPAISPLDVGSTNSPADDIRQLIELYALDM